MPYFRALGYAALAGASCLVPRVATGRARAAAPGSTLRKAVGVAWLASALAFVAALVHHRGGPRAARAMAALAALVVAGWSGFLVWLSMATR